MWGKDAVYVVRVYGCMHAVAYDWIIEMRGRAHRSTFIGSLTGHSIRTAIIESIESVGSIDRRSTKHKQVVIYCRDRVTG